MSLKLSPTLSICDTCGDDKNFGRRKRTIPLPEESDDEAQTDSLELPPIPASFSQITQKGTETFETTYQRNLIPCSSSTGTVSTVPYTGSHTNAVQHAEFQRQVLRLLNLVRLTLQQQGELLQAIFDRQVNTDAIIPASAMISAPFTTSEALEELNASLDEHRKAQHAQEFATLGGSDVGQAARNMLCYLMNDTVASEYNWLGQKGKKKFALLNFTRVIFQALRQNEKLTASRSDIEVAIKSWLCHTKERVTKVQERALTN